MNRRYFHVVAAISFGLIFQSCSTPLYLPCTPNIPITDTTKNGLIEFGLNNRGLEFKGTARIKGPYSVSFTVSGLGGGNNNEFLLGYLKVKKDMVYSVSAGYGLGSIDFHEGSGSSYLDLTGKGKYQKAFIQPMIAGVTKNSMMGLVLKGGFIPYKITDLYYNYPKPPELKLDNYYSSTFFEGWFFYRYISDYGVAFSFYLGFYSFNTTLPINRRFLKGDSAGGFSLGFKF